jgi:hypothetical protein
MGLAKAQRKPSADKPSRGIEASAMAATANGDRRKDLTMPIIENTARIPDVPDDFHVLEIEDIETIEGTKYGGPDVPETRIKMTLRVRTPGAPDESFPAWMSPKLGEKATLGGIVRAALGAAPTDPAFNTDVLIGCVFRMMVTHNERGWPALVPGTAAPAKRALSESEPSF